MTKIVVTTNSKAIKRVILILQKWIRFTVLSFRSPRNIFSAVSKFISAYYDKVALQLLTDSVLYGTSITSANTNGVKVTWTRLNPDEYIEPYPDVPDITKKQFKDETKWLDIIWKDKLVQINGKGKIRAKRQKKNTR